MQNLTSTYETKAERSEGHRPFIEMHVLYISLYIKEAQKH